MPYSSACSAVRKLSRSVSRAICSTGLPVCFAISTLSRCAQAKDVLGVDLDVGRLALEAAQRLVDHHVGIGQREALALGARGEQERAHADAAMPTHSVDTSGLMNCIVS